jgi:predicted nucleotidyltransferase
MTLTVNNKKLTLHFLTVVGSTLHGLNGVDSDTDVKGVFTWEKDVQLGLLDAPEQLDKNMNKEDRAELMQQLNQKFNREFDNDLDLFEAKKFMKNAMKTDPNMLDMLNADKVQGMVLYCTREFKEVLDNRDLFLNFELAHKRFTGMSFNCLKLGKKETNKNKFKDLAKSLQSLFSLLNTVENGEFNPRLNRSQTLTVLDFKNNLRDLEHKDLLRECRTLRDNLEEDCDNLELPKLTEETKQENFKKFNTMLLNLRKSN